MDYLAVLKADGVTDMHFDLGGKPLPFHKYKSFHCEYNGERFNYKRTFIDDIKQITYYIHEKEGN